MFFLQVYVEHKKTMLKTGSAGMTKTASKEMAKRMCISRLESKQWLEEWLAF
jgi:hypothetical protein